MKQEEMNRLVKETADKIKAQREEAIKELADKLNAAENNKTSTDHEEAKKPVGGRLTLEDLLDEIDDDDKLDESEVVVINPEAVDYMNPEADVDYREISVMYDNKYNDDLKIADAEVCVEFDDDMPYQTVELALLKALGETMYADIKSKIPEVDTILSKEECMKSVCDVFNDALVKLSVIAIGNTMGAMKNEFVDSFINELLGEEE